MAGRTDRRAPSRPTLHVFVSGAQAGLQAFTITDSGATLPEKFAPWTLSGSIDHTSSPPHGLNRAAIERGIARDGYQLFRRTAPTPPTN